MAALPPGPRFEPTPPGTGTISPQESAAYTGALLEDLRKMAAGQGQHLLAHLLELARFEARSLAGKAES